MHQHKRALDEACVSPQPVKLLKQMRDEEQEEEVVDVVPEVKGSSPHCKVALPPPQCVVETKERDERENSSSQEHSGLDVQECASSPAPRVWETILPPVRRLVRIDPSCQAEVPAWDPSAAGISDDDSSYYLGQRLWPVPQAQSNPRDERLVGSGRQSECDCGEPGSIECVKRHVEEQRGRIAAELGPAFSWMGFEEMGDVVAEQWSEEEQRAFKSLVMMNPSSQHRDFWSQLRVAFPSRSPKELVSYYFNVFMLRRRALQNRFYPQVIDSDFDEGDLSDDEEMEFSDSEEDEERGSLRLQLEQEQVLEREQLLEEEEDEEEEEFEQEEGGVEVSESYGGGGDGDGDDDDEVCREGGRLEVSKDDKRLSFADTEAEIMRLATLGGNDSWLPASSSSALELTSTNGAMQEIFGGNL